MGCFGYICKGCNTSIRGDCFAGGEKCVMIHVRNGVEVGRTEGHYDEYGQVVEDKIFRSDDMNSPNNHSAICESECDLGKDSGIVAYHSICYQRAIADGSFNLELSENDPNQSWGKVRKRYI